MSYRLPFDGSYLLTVSFQGHLNSGNATVRANPGVDWSMPIGTPLYAVENGTVTQHKDQYGALWVKLISADRRREWRYVHLSRYGHSGVVDTGMHIGFSGNTGISIGAHLHLGLKELSSWKDPMIYLTEDAGDAAKLREVLRTQRPDVIEAGVPVLDWWYANGVYELLASLERIGRQDVIDASRTVPDSAYWLMNWYITSGSKEYAVPPYIWGAQPPPPPVDPCQEKIDAALAVQSREYEKQIAELKAKAKAEVPVLEASANRLKAL